MATNLAEAEATAQANEQAPTSGQAPETAAAETDAPETPAPTPVRAPVCQNPILRGISVKLLQPSETLADRLHRNRGAHHRRHSVDPSNGPRRPCLTDHPGTYTKRSRRASWKQTFPTATTRPSTMVCVIKCKPMLKVTTDSDTGRLSEIGLHPLYSRDQLLNTLSEKALTPLRQNANAGAKDGTRMH